MEEEAPKKKQKTSSSMGSPFNADKLEEKLEEHFRRISEDKKIISGTTHRYEIQKEFHEKDLYWLEQVQPHRFETTLTTGNLYHPGIIDDMIVKVDNVLGKKIIQGIMVKGPQGIGKSHSLVNLV